MCRVHELISCTSKEERVAAAKEKRQKVKEQKKADKRKASPKAKQAAKANCPTFLDCGGSMPDQEA